jgi:hypothetical protein
LLRILALLGILVLFGIMGLVQPCRLVMVELLDTTLGSLATANPGHGFVFVQTPSPIISTSMC